MALISVTRLRVRSLRYMPGFLYYALRSSNQARRAHGNLGIGLLNDAHRTFWTRTAWKDEASMRAFMTAKPHLQAMARLMNWCDEASVVHWEQDSSDLPGWLEAHTQMMERGRRSKVRHPSANHQAFQISPPRHP